MSDTNDETAAPKKKAPAKRKAPVKKKIAVKKAAAKKAAPKTKRKSASAAMSDAAVKAKTGRTWSQWFTLLDKAGAAKMTHKAIAELIATRHKIPGWWAQMVTVGYERARGLRKMNETLTGFRTSVSRTLDAGVDAAFDAWDNAKTRAAFLKEAVDFSTRNPGKNLRFTWKVGRVEVRFVVKGPKKTQVTVDHEGLASAADVGKVKAQWSAALNKLGDKLGGRLRSRIKKA
ncbi:MAG: hypothetical protein AB7I36_13690 [Rhodospirillaceae bacterium]